MRSLASLRASKVHEMAERLHQKLQTMGTRQVRFYRGMLLTYPYPAREGYGTRGVLVGIYTASARLRWIEDDISRALDEINASALVPTEPNVIRRLEVQAMTSLTRSEIYRMMKEHRFPASIPVGTRGVGWRIEEVRAWVAARELRRAARKVRTQ